MVVLVVDVDFDISDVVGAVAGVVDDVVGGAGGAGAGVVDDDVVVAFCLWRLFDGQGVIYVDVSRIAAGMASDDAFQNVGRQCNSYKSTLL